ncbi:MAG: hypothetical protein WCA35_11190 [Kovacikia sp.]
MPETTKKSAEAVASITVAIEVIRADPYPDVHLDGDRAILDSHH